MAFSDVLIRMQTSPMHFQTRNVVYAADKVILSSRQSAAAAVVSSRNAAQTPMNTLLFDMTDVRDSACLLFQTEWTEKKTTVPIS